MNRLMVALCLLTLATNSAYADYGALKQKAGADLAASFDKEFTSPTSDILQAIGQVVVNKAVRGGWAELSTRLADLAGCDQTPPTLPNTCDVLGKARIEDLIASPRTLLDAFTKDMLAIAKKHFDTLTSPVKATVVGLIAGWVVFGNDTVARTIKPWLQDQLKTYAGEVKCPKEKAAAVAWVLGECYANATTPQPLAEIGTCNVDTYVEKCSFSKDDKDAIEHVAALGIVTIEGLEGGGTPADKKANRDHAIQLFFEWGKLADNTNQALLGGLEDLFLGFSDEDWTRAVIGLGRVAETVNTKDCDEDKHECTIGMKLVRIVGAVGHFAETYNDKENSGDPAAAREKVIEDLVASLVDRSEREHGIVVSLGGALGLLAGARLSDDGKQIAPPVRLTLGLGLQTYSTKARGLHVSIDAFDLGEYVTYSQGSLDVGSPDLKSVLIAGATLGYWFANRETPIFVAAHASASPFVKTMDGKVTYEAGVMLGIYVPLLDFN